MVGLQGLIVLRVYAKVSGCGTNGKHADHRCSACDLCHSAKQVSGLLHLILCSLTKPSSSFPPSSPSPVFTIYFIRRSSRTLHFLGFPEMLWRPPIMHPMHSRRMELQLCPASTQTDRSKGGKGVKRDGSGWRRSERYT